MNPPIQTGNQRALSPRRAQAQTPTATRKARTSDGDQPRRVGDGQAGQVRPAEEIVGRAVRLEPVTVEK